MKLILDRFIPEKPAIRPKSRTEFFALRIAQKLGGRQAMRQVISLASTYTEAQLLLAYRQVARRNQSGNLLEQFTSELCTGRGNGSSIPRLNLIAIRVERRTVAVAIFDGDHLEHTQCRQLSSAHDKALVSAVGFVNWVLHHFPVESAALEAVPNGNEFQRQILHTAIVQTLRQRMLPIWEVPKGDLFQAYGDPSLKSRKELRQVAIAIWPVLEGTSAKVFAQDAAVLGQYVQVERLFLN